MFHFDTPVSSFGNWKTTIHCRINYEMNNKLKCLSLVTTSIKHLTSHEIQAIEFLLVIPAIKNITFLPTECGSVLFSITVHSTQTSFSHPSEIQSASRSQQTFACSGLRWWVEYCDKESVKPLLIPPKVHTKRLAYAF